MAKQRNPSGTGGLQENKESSEDISHSSVPPECNHSHFARRSNSVAERDVQMIGDSPARTNTSFPSYSAISVSLCSSMRIHAISGLFSRFLISSQISAIEGRPKSQSFGAMESSAVFPSKNSSSVKRGRRSLFSTISFLNVSNSIIFVLPPNSDLLLLYFYFTTFPRAWKYLLFRADFRPYGYTGWAVFSV